MPVTDRDPAVLEAAPDVWRITATMPYRPRSVHAYLVRGEGGWMLLDGGIDAEAAWRVVDRAVRELAGGWSSVGVQLVSHMHGDHIGLLRRVIASAETAIVMGGLDAARAAHAAADPGEEAEYRADLLRRCGAPDDFVRTIAAPAAQPPDPFPHVAHPLDTARAELPGSPDWTAISTPGHTAGHTSFFRDRDRVLLAGDAILPRITPTIGVNRQREDPVGDYLQTLDRLEALDPTIALCGHGDPLRDPRRRISELRSETRSETERVEAALGSDPLTVWQITERRYAGRDLPVGPRMLALRETLAHLEHLRTRGAVNRETRSGGDRFSRD